MKNIPTLRGRSRAIARTRRSRRGATVVEYSLMLALIGVVLIVAVLQLTQHLKSSYTRVNDAVVAAVNEHDTDAAAAAAGSANTVPGGNN